MLSRLEVALVRFIYSPVTESAARHAAFAAVSVLLASGGSVTTAVVVSAGAAAARAAYLVFKGAFEKRVAA